MTQSGRGEQAADGTYRPLPIPHEPQTPAVPEAREGVVLPAHGEQWDAPTQVVQPAAGLPWGDPHQAARQQPAPQPAYLAQQAQPPHYVQQQPQQPGAEGEATQLIGHYGQAGQQLQPRHAAPAAQTEQSAERTQQLRRPMSMPLPPEQEFHAPVPPLPEQPPAPQPSPQQPRPAMPQATPYAIRPGAPGDHPPVALPQSGQQEGVGTAAATEQLPRYDEAWQSPQQSPPPQTQQPQAQQPQDDYDYLYRRDDEAAPSTRVMPPVPPSQAGPVQPPQYDYGQGGGHSHGGAGRGRKKLSTGAVIGIAVAACGVVGLAGGALLSGGGSNSSDQQKTGATSPATHASTPTSGTNAAAAQQAQSLDALLGQSGSSRTTVINSVQSIKGCTNLPAAAADLRGAAGQRDALVTQLSQLSLGQLPNHAQLVSELSAAWKQSAAADEHYAQWADQMAKGKNACHKGHASVTPQMQQGNASSGEATYAKQQAAALWNPIAKQYGLTQRQFSQL